MEEADCKSCSENVKAKTQITDAQINEAIERLAKSRKIKFADEETYKRRLSECMECRYLESGATCLQCGCIVQIRAKLADASCPFPKANKWSGKAGGQQLGCNDRSIKAEV